MCALWLAVVRRREAKREVTEAKKFRAKRTEPRLPECSRRLATESPSEKSRSTPKRTTLIVAIATRHESRTDSPLTHPQQHAPLLTRSSCRKWSVCDQICCVQRASSLGCCSVDSISVAARTRPVNATPATACRHLIRPAVALARSNTRHSRYTRPGDAQIRCNQHNHCFDSTCAAPLPPSTQHRNTAHCRIASQRALALPRTHSLTLHAHLSIALLLSHVQSPTSF